MSETDRQRELARHERWLLVWGAISLGMLAVIVWVVPDGMPFLGWGLLALIAVLVNFAFWPHAKAADRLRGKLRR